MTLAANTLPWPQRRSPQSAFTGSRDFHSVAELCRFTADEIRASKIQYSQIASKAGCCPATVSKLAHGETTEPRASTLLKILAALGFTITVRT